MSIEFERRFLLPGLPELNGANSIEIVQAYITTDIQKTTRVRLYGDEAFMTIKGPRVEGASIEIEFPIPILQARQILEQILTPDDALSKIRHKWKSPDGHLWEIDQFTGRHEGLFIAELELADKDTAYQKPEWLKGAVEITNDNRFANGALLHLKGEEITKLSNSVLQTIPSHTSKAPVFAP